MTEVVKGYLVLVIEEASGKTRDDRFTWDTHGRFDGFVKGKPQPICVAALLQFDSASDDIFPALQSKSAAAPGASRCAAQSVQRSRWFLALRSIPRRPPAPARR